MRSLAAENGTETTVDLNLEFEGRRAFVIWDSVSLGSYQLKARLEIDPTLLQKVGCHSCDYLYCGTLVLPRPQDN
jgi:hypothetical protein